LRPGLGSALTNGSLALDGAGGFFPALVRWQREHGRHGLPWQGTRDPYRVWLSEIMLQQTQVSTVLAYYDRFLQHFPNVQTLARAPLDEVLGLWSGLGYYSRARNLHRAAQQWVAHWGQGSPTTAQEWQTLSGIGPSTAAAIAAFCFGEKVSILDGNVKRVLARLLAFDGDLAQVRHEQQLWQHAQALLPESASHEEMVHYTQGFMDLGATVCRRTQPQCLLCPAQDLCQAHRQQRPLAFPVKTRKLQRRTEAWCLLVIQRPDGAVWLVQRPSRGIWAGLHCFPVFPGLDEGLHTLAAMGVAPAGSAVLGEPLRHSLTHRELLLHLVELAVNEAATGLLEASTETSGRWVRTAADLDMGLPAPIRTWLVARLAP
jgi:A/G-specific adenine glycosylase